MSGRGTGKLARARFNCGRHPIEDRAWNGGGGGSMSPFPVPFRVRDAPGPTALALALMKATGTDSLRDAVAAVVQPKTA